MTSTPKIAVIGAGISGIAAANELIKHGLTDVTVYEALKRIGGRINTIYYEPNGKFTL
jgi:tryptophan 2-monooxygenase